MVAGVVVAAVVGGTSPLWWPDGDDKSTLVVVTVTRLAECHEATQSCEQAPLQGATVTVDGVGTKVTPSSGVVRFRADHSGATTIVVRKQPYRTGRGAAMLNPGGAVDSSFVMLTTDQ